MQFFPSNGSLHNSFGGKILPLLLLGLAAFLPPTAMGAQTSSDANDSRTLQLYSEAKDAEARGDVPGAVEKYEAILQIAPRLGAAYNNLGALYLRQHEYAKAVAILEKGLKVDPKMQSAAALLGISLYEIREYEKARPRLEAAVRSNPKDDNAELFLANDLIKLGEFESAAVHLQALSRRQPNNQEVWYLLGNVYRQLSMNALTKLNAIDPNSILVHEVSGEIMESMKNFDGALVEYKKAVEIAPRQPGTHDRLGNAYWELLMWEPATQEFRAELANDPYNCNARWKIGDILLEQHLDPEQALAEINKALDLCPTLTDARVDRARALQRLNRHEEAIPDLQAAEKASPDAANIHFLLSQSYRAVGRKEEAQAEMQLFSKLEESSRDASAERAKRLLQDRDNTAPNNQ